VKPYTFCTCILLQETAGENFPYNNSQQVTEVFLLRNDKLIDQVNHNFTLSLTVLSARLGRVSSFATLQNPPRNALLTTFSFSITTSFPDASDAFIGISL